MRDAPKLTAERRKDEEKIVMFIRFVYKEIISKPTI